MGRETWNPPATETAVPAIENARRFTEEAAGGFGYALF